MSLHTSTRFKGFVGVPVAAAHDGALGTAACCRGMVKLVLPRQNASGEGVERVEPNA